MFYLPATYCKTEVILFQEREKISLSNEFSCAEKVKFLVFSGLSFYRSPPIFSIKPQK